MALSITRDIKLRTSLDPLILSSVLSVRMNVRVISVESFQDYAAEYGDQAAWDMLAEAMAAGLAAELRKAWGTRPEP